MVELTRLCVIPAHCSQCVRRRLLRDMAKKAQWNSRSQCSDSQVLFILFRPSAVCEGFQAENLYSVTHGYVVCLCCYNKMQQVLFTIRLHIYIVFGDYRIFILETVNALYLYSTNEISCTWISVANLHNYPIHIFPISGKK